MKKVIYALTLSLVVVGGIVLAAREIKNENYHKRSLRPLSTAERNAAMKKWEASPDGQKLKKWDASPTGVRVHLSADKIRKHVTDFTNIEAVVTSLSYPSGTLGGVGMMVKINGEDYILHLQPEKSNNVFLSTTTDFQELNSLKVNDRIVIRSHSTSYAPKYPYLIISGDYVERDNKIVFKRPVRTDGC